MRVSLVASLGVVFLAACGSISVSAPDFGAGGDSGSASDVAQPDDVAGVDPGAKDTFVPDGCVPACSGRVCGDDGCGGTCGSCPSGQACTGAGQCECKPGVGKVCCEGPAVCTVDGCGNVGEQIVACPSGCDTATNTCVGCTGDCAGKACGDDGCGGSCGTCTSPAYCSEDFQCVSCVKDHTACCPDDSGDLCWIDSCGQTMSVAEDCPQTCENGACKTCTCAGKDCGDDGCGGICGFCTAPAYCGDGKCVGCDLELELTVKTEVVIATGAWSVAGPEGTWGPFGCAEEWPKDINIPIGGPGLTLVWQYTCPAPSEIFVKLFQDGTYIETIGLVIRDPAGSSLYGYQAVNCVVAGYVPMPWDCKDGMAGTIKFSCEVFQPK